MSKNSRETFHHGNVKQAAIEAAWDIVRTEGQSKLSMRKVAQRLGVAHRALYNHFADREALLDAIAIRGFDALADMLQHSPSQSEFVSIYIGFATQDEALYDIMMSRPHATMSDTPSLQNAVHRTISKAIDLFGRPDAVGSSENRETVMKATMLLHGGLMLLRNGILDVDGEAQFVQMMQSMLQTTKA